MFNCLFSCGFAFKMSEQIAWRRIFSKNLFATSQISERMGTQERRDTYVRFIILKYRTNLYLRS